MSTTFTITFDKDHVDIPVLVADTDGNEWPIPGSRAFTFMAALFVELAVAEANKVNSAVVDALVESSFPTEAELDTDDELRAGLDPVTESLTDLRNAQLEATGDAYERQPVNAPYGTHVNSGEVR